MSEAAWLERGAPGWPARLDHLGEPAAGLWVRGGAAALMGPAVAVVGARRATPGALLVARDLGRDLAALGVSVISGMARGVDGAAHVGALDGAGVTVAVLGCGIDLCYPAEHRTLRDRIIESGCVVSEDAGDAPPLAWRFPRRNRLIAALAEAVVVVEATVKSGALSTARWAADLGREVLAVPGSIRNPTSAGTNLLIRDGVRPFLGVGDLLEAVPGLGRAGGRAPGFGTGRVGEAGGSPVCAMPSSTPLSRRVLELLAGDPVHPDDLARSLGVPMTELAAALTVLELDGAIANVCGGRLARIL